jgi:two-component system nitrate/nitrite response regulator NarP
MSRILLADDHPMIRTAIEVLLRDTAHEVAGMAASASEALDQLEIVQPDILLLDLAMPNGGGMSVARKLKSAGSPQKVVILTAAIDDSTLMEARTLGVRGMVLKSSDPAFLIECLDKVQAGGTWLDPELAARVEELSETFGEARRPALAPRERQLIRFVRQGLRNKEIANELGVTEGTVKVYMHGIFEKLGVSTRTELAVRADEFLAESYSRSAP